MKILLIVMYGTAIVTVGFAFIEYLLFGRSQSKMRKRYLLRQRKDELVFHAVEQRILVSDPLFKDMFQFLESFEEVCDHVSLRHLLENLEKRKSNPLNEQNAHKLFQRIEKSNDDVKVTLENSLRDAVFIVISNSLTIRFLFYLLKIAFFRKFPNWLKKRVRPALGTMLTTAKAIVVIDENIGVMAR